MQIPTRVDWWVHRIATNERYCVSPHEIRERWSWPEVLEAHALLDAFEDAERGG